MLHNGFCYLKGADVDRAVIGTATTAHTSAQCFLIVGFVIIKELMLMSPLEP
jgi:hypothetical protein